MKILFYDMGSYTCTDLLYYLKKEGHTVQTIYYHFPDRYEDAFFCERFASYLQKDTYDFVISINFFPLVAVLCDQYHIKYLSWGYDSPLDERLEKYFDYETNYIFLFDRIETEQYQARGHNHVFHLPLAVNTKRLDAISYTSRQRSMYQCDISFVGHLYESTLDILLYSADSYIKGYIEGMIQAQLRIYGCYILDELITDDILNTINHSFKKVNANAPLLNRRGLSYAIATQITHMERSFLLEQMGELYDTHFYTTRPCQLANVKKHGPLKYLEDMPGVFRFSRLNLNPTLKCIQSGIPLRALDIMGAKGVLFSNYQPELAEHFIDGQDVIMYESMEDAFAKADFYLHHEELCRQIADSGYLKAKESFSYPERIKEMFKTADLY